MSAVSRLKACFCLAAYLVIAGCDPNSGPTVTPFIPQPTPPPKIIIDTTPKFTDPFAGEGTVICDSVDHLDPTQPSGTFSLNLDTNVVANQRPGSSRTTIYGQDVVCGVDVSFYADFDYPTCGFTTASAAVPLTYNPFTAGCSNHSGFDIDGFPTEDWVSFAALLYNNVEATGSFSCNFDEPGFQDVWLDLSNCRSK